MARKNKLIELPPSIEEAKGELTKQPEAAPLKPDKRSQRSAGRSCQFNIHVPESFKEQYEAIKKRDRLLNRWHWAAVAMQAYNALSKEERERLIAEVVENDPAMQQFPDMKR
jgi:hypothetical protein